jgi:cell division protein FtsW
MARGRQSKSGSPSYFILVLVFVLTIVGLVALASASFELGKMQFNDSYYYLKHQIIYGLLLGIIGFIFTSRFPYYKYKKFAIWFFFASIILLLLVFTPLGLKIGGARRWVGIHSFSFQPAEIVKLTFIIYLAAWFSSLKTEQLKNFIKTLLPFLIICAVIAGLLALEPTTSSIVIIIGAAFVMFFFFGVPWKYVILTLLVAFIGFALLIYLTPYRFSRILTFLHPSENSLTTSYQINQSLINIGSGGLTGLGYGKSAMKIWLPASLNDSIFSIVASELGFVGASVIITLFFILVLAIFYLAFKSEDKFARLLLVGFGSEIFIQSFMNIASVSGLIPLTGVALPFISYGGTGLMVFLTMSGIIINISKSNG